MRKLQYGTFFFILLLFLLSGSTAEHRRENPKVPVYVTHIRVNGYNGPESLDRLYIQPEKTGTLLSYLRWINPRGVPDTDPEQFGGSYVDITLYYSNGQSRVYRQRSDRFLSKHDNPWEKIDPERGQYLLPILRAIPSDREPEK